MGWVSKILGGLFAQKAAPEIPQAKTAEFVYVPLKHVQEVVRHLYRGPDDLRSITQDDIAHGFTHFGKMMTATPILRVDETMFSEYGERLIVLGTRLPSMCSLADNIRIPRAHWDFLQSQGERIVIAASRYEEAAARSKGQTVMPIAPQPATENLRIFAARMEQLSNFAAFGTELIAEAQRAPEEQKQAPRYRPF